MKGALVMQGSEIESKTGPLVVKPFTLLNFDLFILEEGVRRPVLEIDGQLQTAVSFRKGRAGAIDEAIVAARMHAAALGHEVTSVIMEIP